MKTFKLYLIRHGLTQGNLNGRYVGAQTDEPLCEAGANQLRQMQGLYVYPRVGLVFTSPLKRAVESADILFPQVQKRYEIEDLREYNFGEFEGKTVAELANKPAYKKWLNPENNYLPAGAESPQAFNSRCAHALMGMVEFLIKGNISEAACVTHGGVIMAMLAQKGLPRQPLLNWQCEVGRGFSVQASAAMFMRDNMVEVTGSIPSGS